MPDVAFELGVDLRSASALPVRVEQIEHLRADEHVLLERNRPVLVDDDRDLAPDRLNPVTELLGVADRRRQAHHAHRRV